MRNYYKRILIGFFLVLTLLPPVFPQSVSTDKSSYTPGETVQISGSDFPSNSDVIIQVNDPNGLVKFVDQVTTDSSGTFTSSYKISSGSITGVYTIHASSYGIHVQDTFSVGSTVTTTTPQPTTTPVPTTTTTTTTIQTTQVQTTTTVLTTTTSTTSTTILTTTTSTSVTTTTTTLLDCGEVCSGLGYNAATCGTCPADGSCSENSCRWDSSSQGTGPWSDCGLNDCCCFRVVLCEPECTEQCTLSGCSGFTTITSTTTTTSTTLSTSTTTELPTTPTTTVTTTVLSSTSTTVPVTTTTYKVSIKSIQILDPSQNPISSVVNGENFFVSVSIENLGIQEENPLLLIQIKDPENKVRTHVSSLKSKLDVGRENTLEASYAASELEGIHTVQVFAWTDWASSGGIPLTSPSSITFEVV